VGVVCRRVGFACGGVLGCQRWGRGPAACGPGGGADWAMGRPLPGAHRLTGDTDARAARVAAAAPC